MDKDELKNSLTKEQIIDLMNYLGSGNKTDSNGNPYFQTICHNNDGNGSWKLYYYDDVKSFKCYTECGMFDIFGLVQKVKNIPFIQALNFVQSYFGFGDRKKDGFNTENFELTDDWDIINKYNDYDKILEKDTHEYEFIPKELLTIFDNYYPQEWLDDKIDEKTMDIFQIKMFLHKKQIIIPHFDIENNLIGIRCRYLDPYDYEYLNKGKYNPLYLQNKMYNHSLQNNLYGLNLTRNAIIRTKKCIIFESEKSVMKCQGFYNNNNFAVAICGHSVSKTQRDIILSLGVKEVFIALDKDYIDEESDEGKKCAESILKECYKFAPYVTTYLLWDTNESNLLGYKDAPCDKGKEILELLMKNKYEILSKEGENIGRKRKANRN